MEPIISDIINSGGNASSVKCVNGNVIYIACDIHPDMVCVVIPQYQPTEISSRIFSLKHGNTLFRLVLFDSNSVQIFDHMKFFREEVTLSSFLQPTKYTETTTSCLPCRAQPRFAGQPVRTRKVPANTVQVSPVGIKRTAPKEYTIGTTIKLASDAVELSLDDCLIVAMYLRSGVTIEGPSGETVVWKFVQTQETRNMKDLPEVLEKLNFVKFTRVLIFSVMTIEKQAEKLVALVKGYESLIAKTNDDKGKLQRNLIESAKSLLS